MCWFEGCIPRSPPLPSSSPTRWLTAGGQGSGRTSDGLPGWSLPLPDQIGSPSRGHEVPVTRECHAASAHLPVSRGPVNLCRPWSGPAQPGWDGETKGNYHGRVRSTQD